MRRLFTAVLIAVLTVVLIEAPVMGAATSSRSAPIGVIVSADNSNWGVDRTFSGAAVYDGDRLQAPGKGILQIRIGSGEIILRGDSIAEFHSFPKGYAAELEYGTVVASSAQGQTFQLVADGATIRPANAAPASVQVTMVTPKELLVTGARGTLTISMGDEVNTVEAGNSYRLEVVSDEANPGQTSGNTTAQPTARRRFLWFFIPAVSVLTGILIWRALVSDKDPSTPPNLQVH